MPTTKTQVNISIPADAKEKLDDMAKAHLHSRNVEIEYLIRLAWQQFEESGESAGMLPPVDDDISPQARGVVNRGLS